MPGIVVPPAFLSWMKMAYSQSMHFSEHLSYIKHFISMHGYLIINVLKTCNFLILKKNEMGRVRWAQLNYTTHGRGIRLRGTLTMGLGPGRLNWDGAAAHLHAGGGPRGRSSADGSGASSSSSSLVPE
jgi:hypothetical protein